MTGLVLKLAPKERVLVNGAVLENGDRRSRFSILTPSANVLRLRDAIAPEDVVGPVARLCFQLQLVLAGNSRPEDAKPQLSSQLNQLMGVLSDQFSTSHLKSALKALDENNFYRALKSARALLPLENALFVKTDRG